MVQLAGASFFPVAVLLANILGSFTAGVLYESPFFQNRFSPEFLSAVSLGLLGGFTTFSAFSIDTMRFISAGNLHYAFLNIISNVILSLLACYIGIKVGSQFVGSSL